MGGVRAERRKIQFQGAKGLPESLPGVSPLTSGPKEKSWSMGTRASCRNLPDCQLGPRGAAPLEGAWPSIA